MDISGGAYNNVSYLKARDPSILSRNCVFLPKTNLCDQFGEPTQLVEAEEQSSHLRVYLLIKKADNFNNLYKVEGNNSLTSMVPDGSHFIRNIRDGETMTRTYSFTKIFNSNTTQRNIFNEVVKQKILDFINGQNSSLLTYGASGSGKTFTVIGTDEEPGIVPRSLEYLFRTLPQLTKTPRAKPSAAGDITLLDESSSRREKLFCRSLLGSASTASTDRAHHQKVYLAMQQRLSTEPVAELEDYSDVSIGVWISFAEIYNEHIYDLLQTDPPRGQQRPKLRIGMSKGQAYIKNLTNVSVTSGQEAYELLQYGLHNLNYAATRVNQHSSRSHSIFSIQLVQLNEAEQGSCVSTFNFCDLAGSERCKKTHNVGERLKESNNINTSLLVLGKCISAVRNLQKNNPKDHKLVPFRESKLTQLFQRALAGGEDIAMIVNINPTREMFDESQHVLNFSAVAKDIVLEAKPERKQRRKSMLQKVAEKDSYQDAFDYDKEQEYIETIANLQEELVQMTLKCEEAEKSALQYIRSHYDKLFEDFLEERKQEEQAMRLKYERQLQQMKWKYEKMIEELKASMVIEIGSSDDEKDAKVNRQDYKDLQEKYEVLERENRKLRVRILELEDESVAQMNAITNLSLQSCSSADEDCIED